jgi:SWIM zinc finger.
MGKNHTPLLVTSGNAKVTIMQSYSRGSSIFIRILASLLLFVSLLICLVNPIFGIIGIFIGVFLFKNSNFKESTIVSISSPRYTGGPTFGEWNKAVHKGIPQMDRFERASHQNMVLLSYNDETGLGMLKSSSGGTYITGPDSCTCDDFSKRSRPCKHIYFVALKMGYSGDDFYSINSP